jgi:Fe-S oxidoreductase/coenzyme F420-reducing hydrogenase delta subunit
MSFEPEVVGFCCNWCGYAGADLAGVSRVQYPPNINIIRVMCSGRVEPHHILNALEMGADGVMVIGCHPGDCHYISGNEKAEKHIELAKELLKTLGLDKRVRLEWVSASEGNRFGALVTEFVDELKKLGPNPMKGNWENTSFLKKEEDIGKKIKSLARKTNTYYCLECGKCTASCPITRVKSDYSPMLTVERALRGLSDEIEFDKDIWSCLTCGICSYRCPSNVNYMDFIRGLRSLKVGNGGTCSHGGIVTSLAKFMANPKVKQQDRLGWISNDLKVSKKGDILYYTGCLPYLEPIFRDIKVNSLDVARSTVRILNSIGIRPVVMDDERCCGHDLLWSGGSEDVFGDLARINIASIKKLNVKKVIMSCPECYRTFKLDYPEYTAKNKFDFEVVHTSEFFADLIEKGKMSFKKQSGKKIPITYQDPCRLGRHLGIFDPPRRILESIPDVELIEMENSRGNAKCCGTSAWLNCSTFSKRMQMERLAEAKTTGAKTLITSCLKCQIHFKCTLNEPVIEGIPPKPQIEIKDLSVLICDALGLTRGVA